MCEHDTTLPALSPEEKEKNKQYSLRDTTGQLHTFIAGEADMTEEWIALLRRDENELRSDGVTVVLRQTLGIWIITRIVLTLPVKEYRPVFGFKRVREGAFDAVRRVFSHWRCVFGTPQIALS